MVLSRRKGQFRGRCDISEVALRIATLLVVAGCLLRMFFIEQVLRPAVGVCELLGHGLLVMPKAVED